MEERLTVLKKLHDKKKLHIWKKVQKYTGPAGIKWLSMDFS